MQAEHKHEMTQPPPPKDNEPYPCPTCGTMMDVQKAPVYLSGDSFYCSPRCAGLCGEGVVPLECGVCGGDHHHDSHFG